MNATSIVLLVGLVSFWGALGLAAGFFIRLRKTLETLEATLNRVQGDLAELTPVMSETLREMEKTGQEVGQTAAEVRVLTRKVNACSAPAVIGGAVSYLPAAVGLIKLVKPLFSRRGKK